MILENSTQEEEATNKRQINEGVQQCIRLLIEKFWITREDDEELYYLIKDNEVELKAFFQDMFRYRLIITHELAKLEKVPVKTYNWMGNKEIRGQTIFQRQRDFVFLFCLLAFLEGKGKDDQFSLQNICEAIQAYYPQADDEDPLREDVIIKWKEGSGYQNRLSLIRILKYAMKMNLIVVVDQQIEDFAADSEHDVLFERTPHVSYFIRSFKDLFLINNFEGFTKFLDNENTQYIDGKHRFYRRLFLEPIVYHHEISPEEQDYVKRFYHVIESNINRYTGYEYERYKHNSVLTKTLTVQGEVLHPAENMLANLILRFAGYLLEGPVHFEFSFTNEFDLSNNEMHQILAKLKEKDGRYWTKRFKQMTSEQLRITLTNYLINWNFAEVKDDKTITIKEGLFRIVGDYFEEESLGKKETKR